MRKPTPRSPLRLLYSATLGLALSPVIKVPAVSMPPRNLARRVPIRDTGPAIVEQELGGLPVGSKVLLAIPPLMGYGHNRNPPMYAAPTRWCSSSTSWPRWGQAAKKRKEFSYGPPYMQPFEVMPKPGGYSGQPTRVRYHPKRDKFGTGWTAGSMIVNTSFLMKIIHRISARIILGERSLPEISAGYRTWLVRARRAGSSSGGPVRHPDMPAPGPHETYIPFGNYRNRLLARGTLCANSQVNTDKNRCLR
jgi:hypothetical protein